LNAYNCEENLLYFHDGQIKKKYRFMQNKNQIDQRKMHLRDAEHNAKKLFDQTVKNNWIRSGISELELSDKIHGLAFEMFGTKKHWHKRIVRAGINTLLPYSKKPPDRIIDADDILFFDFGPVFEEWEADLGRTYVLGDNPKKMQLMQDVEECWSLGKMYFDSNPSIAGAELYRYVCSLAEERSWKFGNEHCGHLIGKFPHEKIQGEKTLNYIHPNNHQQMNAPDQYGNPRDWILEIHFIDEALKIGGFYEQLLTC